MSFTKSEKITIAVIALVVGVFFCLAGWFFGRSKANPVVEGLSVENTKLTREKDSLFWVVGARDKSIHKKDSCISVLLSRQAQSDSFYVRNFIKNKNEIKYIQSLDSVRRANRVDSILKRAGIRK